MPSLMRLRAHANGKSWPPAAVFPGAGQLADSLLELNCAGDFADMLIVWVQSRVVVDESPQITAIKRLELGPGVICGKFGSVRLDFGIEINLRCILLRLDMLYGCSIVTAPSLS